jgi:hypothetical protein
MNDIELRIRLEPINKVENLPLCTCYKEMIQIFDFMLFNVIYLLIDGKY